MVTIHVNDDPVARADSYTVFESSVLTVDGPGVLVNDTDAENETLTAQLASGPSHGVLTLNANGSFTYTPNPGFSGDDSFSYRAIAGPIGSPPAVVTIHVNDDPVARADSYTVAESGVLTVDGPGVLVNDTDAENETLTAQLASGPSHGVLTLNANGSFTYTPNSGYSGPDSFTYRAIAGPIGSPPATVSINVSEVNQPPTLGVIAGTVDSSGSVTYTASAVAADADHDILQYSASAPSHGSVTEPVEGTFVYQPDNAYFALRPGGGTDSFDITVDDGHGGTATRTVSYNFVPNQTLNTAVDVNTTGNVGHSSAATAVISGDGKFAFVAEEPGRTVAIVDLSGPTPVVVGRVPFGEGNFGPEYVAVSDDGTRVYISTPWTGPDKFIDATDPGNPQVIPTSAFDHASHQIAISEDGNRVYTAKISGPGWVVSMTDFTDPSQPVRKAVVAPELDATNGYNIFDIKMAVSDDARRAFVVDPRDGSVSVVDFSGSTPTAVTVPAGGRFTLQGDLVVNSDGTRAYIVDRDNGLTIIDATDPAAPQVSSVQVGSGPNDVALSPDGNRVYVINLQSNTMSVVDVSGDNPQVVDTLRIVDAPTTMHLSENGNRAYVQSLFTGNISVIDTSGADQKVIGTISGGGYSLVDVSDDGSRALLLDRASGKLTVLTDPTVTSVPATEMSLALDDAGPPVALMAASGPVTAAAPAAAGPFGVNIAPIAIADFYTTTEDTARVVPVKGVLANDFDLNGDALTAALVTGPSNGNVTFSPTGSFTYTPNANFSGLDSFTYCASDATSSTTATVYVNVTAVNDVPIAVANSYTTPAGTRLTVAQAAGVLTNDTDPDGPVKTAQLVSGPANGTLTLNSNGSFTYTPRANFTGTDTFTYRVSDILSTSAPATVTITVGNPNTAPVANGDSGTVNEGSSAAINVLGNDTDAQGNSTINPASVEVMSGPAAGSTSVNTTTGAITYFSNGAEVLSDSFTYRVKDASGAVSNITTVSIAITPVNDAPVISSLTPSPAEPSTGALTYTLTVADTDTPLQDLDVSVIQPVGRLGTVSEPVSGIPGTYTFTYTPTAAARLRAGLGQVVQPSFTVNVSDGVDVSSDVVDDVPVSPALLNVGAPIAIGLQPHELAFSPDGSVAYVTFGNKVAVIDTETNSVIDTNDATPQVDPISVGFGANGVAFSPDGSLAYVANQNGSPLSVSVIDTTSHTVVDTIPVDVQPFQLAVSPDGKFLYVTSPDAVLVIDTATKAVDTVDGFVVSPYGVAFKPDGSAAYVADVSGMVVVIDTTDHSVDKLITGGPLGSLSGTIDVAVSPDGTLAYATDAGSTGRVSVIDTASNTVIDSISIDGRPRGVAFSPDGSLAFFTDQDNGSVYVVDTGTHDIIDTNPATPALDPLLVGTGAFHVAVSPDENLIYVTNFSNGTVSVISLVPGSGTVV